MIEQQQPKDPLIPFLLTLAGVAVLTLPIHWKAKIGVGAIAAVPGGMFTLSEWSLYRTRRREVERLEKEAIALEDTNEQLTRALDARQAELHQEAERLELEEAKLVQLKVAVEEEIARLKVAATAETDARLSEIAQLEATTGHERDRILEDARRAAADLVRSVELRQANLKGEILATRQSAAQAIKRARARWRGLQALQGQEWRSAIKADRQQLELDRKQLEIDRQALETAIALERAQTAEKIAEELGELQQKKEGIEAEIAALWLDFEKEKQGAIEMFTADMFAENTEKVNEEIRQVNAQLAIKQRELDNLVKETNRELKDKAAELERSYEAKFQEWLVPHVIELNRALEEIEDWRSRYLSVEEELAASKDVVLPENPWTKDHKVKAYQLILWFKSKGVMINYYNSSIDEEEDFTLFFKPWLSGSKGKKAIEGVVEGMISEWGLAARPVIGETKEAWFIKLSPAAKKSRSLEEEMRNFGGFPFSSARVAATDPRLLEPESLLDLDEETRRAVMTEASAQSKIDEMMNFRPGKLPKPVGYAITPQELKVFDWLSNWRASATRNDPGGAKGNIRELNKLMTEAYGVSVGSSTETRDRVTGESLRQRVHRICKLLKIDVETRNRGENN